jgi:hypothetical protein
MIPRVLDPVIGYYAVGMKWKKVKIYTVLFFLRGSSGFARNPIGVFWHQDLKPCTFSRFTAFAD